MRITEEQYYGLIDRVVHEGNPELLLGPLDQLTADLPPSWTKVLSASNPREAAAHLWIPMVDRLPRVCLALRERLHGVGLLLTEEVPASLIYFFSDGDYVFAYRGRLPLSEGRSKINHLPGDFLDFYRIHDGWVLYYSEDGGPAPSTEWVSLSDLWTEVAWKLPPGDASPDTLITVYRDGDEFALAYNISALPALPLSCRNDGTADVLLDMWAAIDREIGSFLEDLDLASDGMEEINQALTHIQRSAMDRYDALIKRIADRRATAAHFSGGGIYEQAYDLYLTSAWLERRRTRDQGKILEYYHQALQHWCMFVDLCDEASPQEMLDMFGLAHALGDTATSHFVATIPTSIWADDSPEALQARVLFCLFLGDVEHATAFVEELLGLTFDGEEPHDKKNEIVVRMLESLCQINPGAYAKWRQAAIDKLCENPAQPTAFLPWNFRLAGFDAVASRIGISGSWSRPVSHVYLVSP